MVRNLEMLLIMTLCTVGDFYLLEDTGKYEANGCRRKQDY